MWGSFRKFRFAFEGEGYWRTSLKAVLFDIDGTILDTLDFVFTAVQYTLDKHRLIITEEKLTQAKGKHLIEFYKSIFPNEDFELLAETHHDFQQDKFDLGKLFPGAQKVLKKLKSEGVLIAAVSNRSKISLVKSFKLLEIDDFFDVIVTFEDVENPKPHKDHPNKALELLGVEKEFAIMVGDTENDILAGKAAGIKTVGVTYGWIGKDIKKANPDFVIDNIEELLKVLKLD